MKTRKLLEKHKKTWRTEDITGHFLSNGVVSRWNLLDQWTVDAPSLNAFKNSLSRIRDKRVAFFMDLVRKALGLAVGGRWSRREAAQNRPTS